MIFWKKTLEVKILQKICEKIDKFTFYFLNILFFPFFKKFQIQFFFYLKFWQRLLKKVFYWPRSAGRVNATRGSEHRGLEHAREKRKWEAQACFVAIAPNSRQVCTNPRCVTPSSDHFGTLLNKSIDLHLYGSSLPPFSNNWDIIVGWHDRWLTHFYEMVLPPPTLLHSISRFWPPVNCQNREIRM
jgi:hypothetical protein